jgi:single-strand DNA-binding protein
VDDASRPAHAVPFAPTRDQWPSFYATVSENTVHLLGNLTADPELKRVGATALATFTVAINFRDKSGKTSAEFFPCEVWGGWAENLVKTAKKGALVAVYGRLKQDTWEDKASQEKRSRVVVRADRVYHLQPRFSEAGEPPPPRGEPTEEPAP